MFSRFQVSKVFPSHSSALGARHGASRGTRLAMSLSCAMATPISGDPVGSGGTAPSGPLDEKRSSVPSR